MARMTRQMANLLLDQMSKVLDFSSQLHHENTKRQQKHIEGRVKRHLEVLAEYMAVLHDDELTDKE
jgi:hypothetical protein